MSITTVTFCKSDKVFTRVYCIGTQAVKNQLTEAGVQWIDGHKRSGFYRQWSVEVTAQHDISKKRIKLPDFLD